MKKSPGVTGLVTGEVSTDSRHPVEEKKTCDGSIPMAREMNGRGSAPRSLPTPERKGGLGPPAAVYVDPET